MKIMDEKNGEDQSERLQVIWRKNEEKEDNSRMIYIFNHYFAILIYFH